VEQMGFKSGVTAEEVTDGESEDGTVMR